jgi:hypothetical protein
MVIKVIDQVNDPETLECAWELYIEAFRDLNALAVQRHLMYRSEFDELMRDQRVQKYMCLDDDGTLLGMSTYTNDLDAVPLIAPEYFERHWPDHYAANKIWYIVAATQNGLVGLDICSYNDDVRNMSRVFRLMIRRLTANMRFERIDQQSFWLYEFPAAA